MKRGANFRVCRYMNMVLIPKDVSDFDIKQEDKQLMQ